MHPELGLTNLDKLPSAETVNSESENRVDMAKRVRRDRDAHQATHLIVFPIAHQ